MPALPSSQPSRALPPCLHTFTCPPPPNPTPPHPHHPHTHTLQAIDRRERLRRLALETIDLSKDPYFMRNHLGQVRPGMPACSL